MKRFRPILVVVLLTLAESLRAQCADGSPPPCAPRPAARVAAASGVAVMYFENSSRDSAYAYLADGLTESLIERLSQSGVSVASRYQVRRIRDSWQQDLTAVGEQLAVSHFLTGTVRPLGSSLRVSVELIRLPSGSRVWGRQFDRPSKDILAVETEIASIVADSVAGKLQPRQRSSLARAPTRSAEAYDHYQRGRFYSAQRTGPSLSRALEEFKRAVRIDPRSGVLRAELALAYATCVGRSVCQSSTFNRDSLQIHGFAAVDTALRIDSTNSLAWTARSLLLRNELIDSGRDLTPAARAAERAIALDSSSAAAWHMYGHLLLYSPDDRSAERALRRALALEPDRAVSLEHLSRIAFFQRRFAETVALIDSAAAADPSYNQEELGLRRAFALYRLGRIREARLALNRSGAMEGDVATYILLAEGDTARAHGIAEAMERRSTFDAVSALAAIGEKDRALAVLGRVARPTLLTWYILRRPYFDLVRTELEFIRIVAASQPLIPIR